MAARKKTRSATRKKKTAAGKKTARKRPSTRKAAKKKVAKKKAAPRKATRTGAKAPQPAVSIRDTARSFALHRLR